MFTVAKTVERTATTPSAVLIHRSRRQLASSSSFVSSNLIQVPLASPALLFSSGDSTYHRQTIITLLVTVFALAYSGCGGAARATIRKIHHSPHDHNIFFHDISDAANCSSSSVLHASVAAAAAISAPPELYRSCSGADPQLQQSPEQVGLCNW